ncbi:uncharacterized protein [Nicotiana sylvestris]|uniref:uncharacterized protein n=1 Tax=Nicotiana sylvestris TaxID=4096 RepID=UPI00388C4A58
MDLDSVTQHQEDEENKSKESAMVHRTRKPIEAVKSSEAETLPFDGETTMKDSSKTFESPEIEIIPLHSTNSPEGTSAERVDATQSAPSEDLGAVTMSHSLSLPCYCKEAIEDARALPTPVPSKAVTKFKAELGQCNAELKKALGEEKDLRLLCCQKEEELKDLRADLAKSQRNKAELDEQARKIEELEAELAKAEAEAAQAKVEIEKTKATADKTIAVYLKNTEAFQVVLRNASGREKWSNDLAKCQARRETLEEIHARGFNLNEEKAQAKALETDTTFLVSSNNKDTVSGSEGGEGKCGAPEEEEVPEDRAPKDVVPEDVDSEDVAPK